MVLEDDGIFILSGWFLGIEHPPGYPLFVLLAKVSTLLPFGSVAWRVHALNGLIAAQWLFGGGQQPELRDWG